MRVVNLYGGPGTGKSTTAAAVFAELKMRGVNCEYVQEYAKDKAWEFGNNCLNVPKVIQAQEYIFGKQHFRMRRCAKDVDVIITDSPLLLSLIYIPADFEMPSLKLVVREAHDIYDNLDVFLVRAKEYNPKGRFHSEDQAKALDGAIQNMLNEQALPFVTITSGRTAADEIINQMISKWGDAIKNIKG